MPVYDYGVYVILLDKKVLELPQFTARSPEFDPDMDCYYVGMSAKTPEDRFAQHKRGEKPNRFVRNFGIRLVPEHYEQIPRFTTRAEAKAREEELAIDLREEGHAAYWNGDDTQDRIGKERNITESWEGFMYESKETTLKKMDESAEKAGNELDLLLKSLNPEQKYGANKIFLWFKENYMEAGYKRLGKIIKELP